MEECSQPYYSMIQAYEVFYGFYECPTRFTSPRNELNGVENLNYLDWIDEDIIQQFLILSLHISQNLLLSPIMEKYLGDICKIIICIINSTTH